MPGEALNRTAAGWPYIDVDNYVDVVPAYTADLAAKLQNSQADVAAAINAAQQAQQAAATTIALASARIAAGQTNVVIAAGATTGTATITLPANRFTAAPVLMWNLRGTSSYITTNSLAVSSATAAQLEVKLTVGQAMPAGGLTIPVYWVAIQA